MAMRRRGSKNRAVGCLALVAVIVGILLFGPFVRDLVDTPFNPWAHSWRGEPTLTGAWIGTGTSREGMSVSLFLDLQRARTGRGNRRYSMCRTCPRIEGGALVCGTGGAQAYEVWGSPDTWGGERFHLRARPPGGSRPAGPRLGHMTGEWAGDALSVETTLEQGGDGADTQVRFEMRRGSEADFRAACRKQGAD